MKKKIVAFLILLLCPLFVFAEEAKESLVSNTNKLSFDVSSTFSMPMGNSIKVKDGYIMQAIGDDSKVVRKINLDGNVVWEVNASKNDSDSRYLYLVNDEEIFILNTNTNGISKINIEDGTVIKNNDSITGKGIVSINDKYFAISSDIKVFNDDLEIIDSFNLSDLCKQLTNLSGSFNLNTFYNDNGKIYLLAYINVNSVKNYYMFSFSKEDLSDLKIEFKLSLEKGGSFADFIKVGDDFYANCDAVYKITSDGVATAIAGRGVDADVAKSYTGIEYNGEYFILSGLAENDEKKVAAVVDLYDKEFNLIETINLSSLYGYDFIEPFVDNFNQISVAKNLTLIDGGFITMGIIDGKIQFLSEYKFPYNIETETDENGSIEVVSEAFYGDMITFRVSPRAGYRLSTLSVTNEALETVVFTEDDLILNSDGTVSVSVNSFTMPRSNVAITAAFEKIPENPNTIDNILFYTGMFIVSIALISGLVLYRRRHS